MSTHPTTVNAPAGLPYVDITRDFDATPAQVFRAHTDPELVVRWLGPRDLEMEVVEWDARSGGGYRYLHRDPEQEYAFRGVFHAVETDRRVVQTFEFEGMPGEVSLEMLTLTETPTGTRMQARSVFGSVEARDGMVAGGMEHGVQEGYEKLDELLAEQVGQTTR